MEAIGVFDNWTLVERLATLFAVLVPAGSLIIWVVRRLTIPKDPEHVRKCIASLTQIRSELDKRPRLIDPHTNKLRFRQPENLDELLKLYKYLRERHSVNADVCKDIMFLLYPSTRGGLKGALKKTYKAIDNVQTQIRSFEKTEGKSEDAKKKSFKRIIKAVVSAGDKMLNLERALLKAIDKSLELWSKRIS